MYIKENERIMGIDPSHKNTGWGIIETKPNNDAVMTEFGCITCIEMQPTSSCGFKYAKYKHTAEEVVRIARFYEVDYFVVETIFMSVVSKPLMMTAEQRAVIMAECTTFAPIYELSSLQAKKCVLGTRNKKLGEKYTKKQMIDEMMKCFGVEIRMNEHAADALALALTFFIRQNIELHGGKDDCCGIKGTDRGKDKGVKKRERKRKGNEV